MKYVIALLAASTLGSACARHESSQPSALPTNADAAPELLRLVPDSADVSLEPVVRVLAIGRHFAATDNVVEFGPVLLRRIASSATGDTIEFTVPLEHESTGGAPPRRLDVGTYELRVMTRAGRSNSLPFRVVGRSVLARFTESSGSLR